MNPAITERRKRIAEVQAKLDELFVEVKDIKADNDVFLSGLQHMSRPPEHHVDNATVAADALAEALLVFPLLTECLDIAKD